MSLHASNTGTSVASTTIATVTKKSSAVTAARPTKTPRNSGLGWHSPHAIVGCLCASAIVIGWIGRNGMSLTPTEGLGYGLGVVGLSMMVLLLSYSIRKRARPLREIGPIRTWFEVHLILGLLGPTLILYHSGFGIGSVNATISLVCVLAVSGSGVGGRFLYGRMHRGLAGPRRSVESIFKRAQNALSPIEEILEKTPLAQKRLEEFEIRAVREPEFPLRIFRTVQLRIHSRLTTRLVVRSTQQSCRSTAETSLVRRAVVENLSELCRAGELRLFERLFALWHAIHIPLTIILFVSAAIHILAVHLY